MIEVRSPMLPLRAWRTSGALLLAIALTGFRNIGVLYANLSLVQVIRVASKNNTPVSDMLTSGLPFTVQMGADSIALVERASALDSSNPQIYGSLGLVYGLSGRYEDAVAALKRSTDLSPGAVWPHFWLGFVYQQAGQADMAFKEWGRAGASPYYVSLGQYYSQRGDHGRATRAFRTGVDLDPRTIDGHFYLGREYLYQGQWKEAIQEFYLTSALAPRFSRAYYFWAVALYQGEKNVAGATDLAKKAVETDPLDLLPYVLLGDIAREARCYGEAEAWYQRAVIIAPTKAEPLLGLGHIRRDQGDMVSATDYYERAILIDLQNSDAYAFLGDAYRRQGRLAEAIEVLQEAISTNQVSWYHLVLARAYRDSGMKDKAVEEYRLFMAMDPMGNRVQSELDDLLR